MILLGMPICSRGEVEKKFKKLKLVPNSFQVIPKSDVQAYRNGQAELREWLATIVSSSSGMKKIRGLVAKRIKETGGAQIVFKDEKLDYVYALNGVQAVCALGVALSIDRKRNITSRLQQCGNKECEKFRIHFAGKGRPRRYCDNGECNALMNRRVAGAARVKRCRLKKIRL